MSLINRIGSWLDARPDTIAIFFLVLLLIQIVTDGPLFFRVADSFLAGYYTMKWIKARG